MPPKKEFTGSICNSDNRKCLGDRMIVNGNNCDVHGNYCIINGNNCNVGGRNCVINGNNCYITQDGNNVVNGDNCSGPGAKAAAGRASSNVFTMSNGSCQSMVQNSTGTYINGVKISGASSSTVVFGNDGITINGRPLRDHDPAAMARLEAHAATLIPRARSPPGHIAMARLDASTAMFGGRSRPTSSSLSSPAAAAAPAPATKKRTPPAPRDEESRKSVKEGQECVVCMDAPRELACIPCGHLCMCEHCAYRLLEEEKKNKCPLCNAEITDTNKIFI